MKLLLLSPHCKLKRLLKSYLSESPLIHSVLKEHILGPLKLIKLLSSCLNFSRLFTRTQLIQLINRSHTQDFTSLYVVDINLTDNILTIKPVPKHRKFVNSTITSYDIKVYCQGYVKQFHKERGNVNLPHSFKLYYMNKIT